MTNRSTFERSSKIIAFVPIAVLVAMLIAIIYMSAPSIRAFGWHFLVSSVWNPVTQQFGALSAIVGTLLTTLIAVVLAVPASLGIAILLSQILDKRIASVIARIVELMAGIPSIIYGMWGLFILVPWIKVYVQPPLMNAFGNVPILKYIFTGLPIGISIFTAGIILAIMIIPLIASMMRDVFENVSPLLVEASYGVGMTRYEFVRHILIHYTRAGLLGSVILGLGRALGETMAITFVIGNQHDLPAGLFMPGSTLSTTIANEFTEATGKLYPAALVELGLILFAITFIVLLISRYMLHHASVRGGSQ